MNGGGYDVGRGSGWNRRSHARSLIPEQAGAISETDESRSWRLQFWPAEPDASAGSAHRCMSPELLHPCATALDQNDQHDHEQHAGYNPDNRGSVHVKSPFLFYLKNVLNESPIVIIAGPRTTRKSEGKINSTSGKTIFTVVLAAISSTF